MKYKQKIKLLPILLTYILLIIQLLAMLPIIWSAKYLNLLFAYKTVFSILLIEYLGAYIVLTIVQWIHKPILKNWPLNSIQPIVIFL